MDAKIYEETGKIMDDYLKLLNPERLTPEEYRKLYTETFRSAVYALQHERYLYICSLSKRRDTKRTRKYYAQ